MGIPYTQQYFVEKRRNDKFQWLSFGVPFIILALHGAFFYWIPYFLRSRRKSDAQNHRMYFKAVSTLNKINSCLRIPIPWRKKDRFYYFQPSLIFVYLCYFALMAIFSFVETKDINYEPRSYIIGKRLGKLAVGNLPCLLLFIIKNNLLSAISGLQPDRLVAFHIWVGRTIWLIATIHLYLCASYWLDMGITLMIFIPPQYFGMIAYAACCFLTWASFRFIRRLSYDFFLIQHRVFAFIMLLFVFFHNSQSRAITIIAIHILVADRVVSRIIGIIHSKKSPSKMISKFETFDEDTLLVTIPIKVNKEIENEKWWRQFLPTYGTWKAGQYILLNIPSVYINQYHPFTICSLARTGNMKLLIRKKKGFTKKLLNKVMQLEDAIETGETLEYSRLAKLRASLFSRIDSLKGSVVRYIKVKVFKKHCNEPPEFKFDNDDTIVKFKASINGPYGGCHHDLIKFDSLLFICGGSGGSAAFPVCLNVLETIDKKDMEQDYLFRPLKSSVKLCWSIKNEVNMIWYKHIIDDMMPYIERGKLELSIHITQSTTDSADLLHTMPDSEAADTKVQEVNELYSTMEVVRHKESAVRYSKEILLNSLVKISYGRIDAAETISKSTMNIVNNCENPKSKSMAVFCCGPSDLSKLVQAECQKNRKVKNSPDIYCYTESF